MEPTRISKVERQTNLFIALLTTRGYLTAERIRQNVADLEVDVAGLILRVTVSVGAIGSSKITAPEASRALVQAADRLLYQAKHLGRNQSRTEWLGHQAAGPPAPAAQVPEQPYPSEAKGIHV